MPENAGRYFNGRSIRQLARAHNRTELAVEAELDRQGLWDRIERRPKQAGDISPPPEFGPASPPPPIPFPADRD